MAGANYSGWSVAKLEKEKEKIDKAIEARKSETRNKAIEELKQVAEKNGFDLRDLVGGSSARSKKSSSRRTGKVAPKYRHPEEPDVTWSGRGRQPKWVAEFEKKNGNLDGITI